jgi:hypothetical protein
LNNNNGCLAKSLCSCYLETMLIKVLFIVACLVLPVVWGWLVHALFRVIERKRFGQDDNDSIFPDFQI